MIVPVDAHETPIKRWKVEIISPDKRNLGYGADGTTGELDGKELECRSDNRPAARFLYLRFILALVGIKNLKRQGWEATWAKYHESRPFPTSPYVRKSILHALATHFEATEMRVVESWMQDHGFDTSLRLAPEESTEVARRVHETVQNVLSRHDRKDREYDQSEWEEEEGDVKWDDSSDDYQSDNETEYDEEGWGLL